MICFAAKENLSLGQKGRAAFVFGRPVCPRCACQLASSSLPKEIFNSRFGLTTRMYYGWCDNCNCCVKVEQFKCGSGRWFIHRWRAYSNDAIPKAGPWTIIKELPVPLIKTGVGGDFDKDYF